jgi:Excreted virulence factor EspC, type VII ESX diderm
MADGGGYEVLAEELTTHAGKVDGFTDRLRTAVDAAHQVTMNNEAFGVICQPFAAMLQPFEERGVEALRQGVETLTDTAGKVRDSVSTYTSLETAGAQQFQAIEGELA